MTRVLIVDDKEENLYYLQALLTGSGFEVNTAHHGAEALVKARQAPPTVVISDLLMPVMDGYTLLRHWKADPVLKKAPFIVYTATYTERADEELALNMGADAFVLKPAEPEALLARLHEVLATTVEPAQPRGLVGDDRALLKIYSQTLIRKLEEKTLQLEESNRALVQDIAERKLVEASLRASEASMAAAQSIAHFGSWEMDLRENEGSDYSDTLRWSDEAYRIAGYTPGGVEVSSELFFKLVPEEDHAKVREAMSRAISERKSYSVLHRLIRPDGEERIIHETAQLFCDEQSGRPQKMIGTAHDITEQRRAEDALKKSEFEQRQLARQLEIERSRLMAAQAVARMGSWETDLATREVIWSEQTHRIFETDPDSHIPTHQGFLELVHPDDRAAVDTAFARSFDQHEASEIEHRIVTLDGKVKYVVERWQIFHDENGQPTRAIGTTQDITERKQAKEELERTHSLLQAVVSGVPDAVFVKDLQGRYLLCNQGTATVVGKKVEDILGKDDTYLFDAEDAQMVMENDREVVLSGEASTDEEVLTAAGVTRTYLATKAPYRDALGEIIGTIGISRDITERKQGELRVELLSELGHRLNTAASPAEAGEIIAEVADKLFGWDAATLDLYSQESGLATAILTMDTLDGRKTRCLPDSDQQPPSAMARQVIEKGARLVLRDDPTLTDSDLQRFGDMSRPSASLMFVPIREGSRNIGVLSIQSYHPNAYTPTDLKILQLLADYCGGALNRIQTESLCRVSEERLREMTENIGDVFYSYHPASNHFLLYANQAYERIWGRPLDALYASPEAYLEGIHPDDRPAAEAAFEQQLDGQRTEVEFRVIQPEGTICWVRELAAPIFNSDGQVERVVGTMRDITERKQAEVRLREQATLLDKAQDAILVRDLEHQVLYWNKSAERLYGWTAKEAVGRSIKELLYQDPMPFLTATSIVLEKGEWVGEIQQFNRDGKALTIEGRWTLVRDDKGRPKSILAINTDITERNKLKQQFLRAQRMESIGTLAGGIAHDLNNVLAPILMSIELLRLQENDPRRLTILSTIESSAKRGADMVRQVLSFARGVEGRQVEVQIGHLLHEIEKIANETFLKTIRVKCSIQDRLWTVNGDPTQLHQVLLNLCVNARDAMPQGGVLSLSASNLMLDEQYAAMHIDAKPGPHVVIQVEDTGSGMPAEVVERIFEPFFTTKELGKGTGLGLSTTLAIANSHGGFVQVQSEPGLGTQFRVFLPAQTKPGITEAIAEENELPRGNGELILVIDDEASVRQITRQTLEIFGYRVLLAADGTEAAGTYAAHKDEIAAVLTDMMMPVMDGQATIQVLRRMNPAVRIIAASGLSTSGMAAKATNAGVKHFIPKPYTAEILLKTLHQMLREPD